MPWRDGLCARLSKPVAALVKELNEAEAAALEEIRIRLKRPAELVWFGERRTFAFVPDRKEMDELVAALSGYALYACERQMAQGYIPLPHGHRAGVCGHLTQEGGAIVRMSGVTSVCIRIARRVEGASEPVRRCLRGEDGQARRVLLIGPPGCGKTTVLRDAAEYLSDWCAMHVAVADEREELHACGWNSDRGAWIDVMAGGSKAQSMRMLIRTLAPQVIVTDEIGCEEEIAALMEAARCGVGLLASAHGGALEDVYRRPMLRRLFENGVFDRYVLLGAHGACLKVWNERGEACTD